MKMMLYYLVAAVVATLVAAFTAVTAWQVVLFLLVAVLFHWQLSGSMKAFGPQNAFIGLVIVALATVPLSVAHGDLLGFVAFSGSVLGACGYFQGTRWAEAGREDPIHGT